MWQCRSCGRSEADGNSFCTACGAIRVNDQTQQGAVQPVAAPSPMPEAAQAEGTGLTDPLHIGVQVALNASQQGSFVGRLIGFALSIVLFFVWGLADRSVTGALVLVAVIFIHEMGHWLGMKALGYRNTSILFIPFFGAAASGTDPQPSGAKHAVVSMLGPVPGVLFGVVAGVVWCVTKDATALEFTKLFFALSFFNLLPIYPLDGGQVLEATLFGRHYVADIVFRVIMGILLIVCAILLDAKGLGILAVFMFISLAARRRIGMVANQLQPFVPDADRIDASKVPPQWLAAIVDTMQALAPRQENAAKNIAVEVRAVWERLCYRQPSAVVSAVLLMLYFGALVASVLAPFGFMVARAMLMPEQG